MLWLLTDMRYVFDTQNIDYTRVAVALESFRKESIEFLERAIEGC